MPSSHLILCRPLLFLSPIPPSIRVFSNESTLCMRWPKYWSFRFSTTTIILSLSLSPPSSVSSSSSPSPLSSFFLHYHHHLHHLYHPHLYYHLITSREIDGETVETVSDFIFWGSKITADGDCNHEIKRCLLLGRKVMTNLDSILKSRDVTLPTKVRLIKAMVFPVVMYGCESWTVKKAER